MSNQPTPEQIEIALLGDAKSLVTALEAGERQLVRFAKQAEKGVRAIEEYGARAMEAPVRIVRAFYSAQAQIADSIRKTTLVAKVEEGKRQEIRRKAAADLRTEVGAKARAEAEIARIEAESADKRKAVTQKYFADSRAIRKTASAEAAAIAEWDARKAAEILQAANLKARVLLEEARAQRVAISEQTATRVLAVETSLAEKLKSIEAEKVAAVKRDEEALTAVYLEQIEFRQRAEATALAWQAEATAKAISNRKKMLDAQAAQQEKARGVLGGGYIIERGGDRMLEAATMSAAPLVAGAVAANSFQTSFLKAVNNTDLSEADRSAVRRFVANLAKNSNLPFDDLFAATMRAANFRREGEDIRDVFKVVDAGAIAATADFAKADDATEALARVMYQFKVPAQDASRVMNMLEVAAAKNNLTLQQLTSSSGRAFAAAAEFKIPLSEAAAAYALLTKEGNSASQSATSLRSIFKNLISPTKQQKEEIAALSHQYGVDLSKAFGIANVQSLGLFGSLDYLSKGVKGNQDAILKLFPDMRANVNAMALMTDRAGDLQDTVNAENKAWTENNRIQGQYAKVAETAGFQAAKLWNRIVLLGDSFSQQLLPAMKDVFGYLDDVAQAFSTLSDDQKRSIVDFLAVTAAVTGLVGGLLKFIGSCAAVAKGVKDVSGWLGTFKTASEDANDAQKLLASDGIKAFASGGMYLIALGLVVAAVLKIADAWDDVLQAQQEAADNEAKLAKQELKLESQGLKGTLIVRRNTLTTMVSHAKDLKEWMTGPNHPTGIPGWDGDSVDRWNKDHPDYTFKSMADMQKAWSDPLLSVGHLQAMLTQVNARLAAAPPDISDLTGPGLKTGAPPKPTYNQTSGGGTESHLSDYDNLKHGKGGGGHVFYPLQPVLGPKPDESLDQNERDERERRKYYGMSLPQLSRQYANSGNYKLILGALDQIGASSLDKATDDDSSREAAQSKYDLANAKLSQTLNAIRSLSGMIASTSAYGSYLGGERHKQEAVVSAQVSVVNKIVSEINALGSSPVDAKDKKAVEARAKAMTALRTQLASAEYSLRLYKQTLSETSDKEREAKDKTDGYRNALSELQGSVVGLQGEKFSAKEKLDKLGASDSVSEAKSLKSERESGSLGSDEYLSRLDALSHEIAGGVGLREGYTGASTADLIKTLDSLPKKTDAAKAALAALRQIQAQIDQEQAARQRAETADFEAAKSQEEKRRELLARRLKFYGLDHDEFVSQLDKSTRDFIVQSGIQVEASDSTERELLDNLASYAESAVGIERKKALDVLEIATRNFGAIDRARKAWAKEEGKDLDKQAKVWEDAFKSVSGRLASGFTDMLTEPGNKGRQFGETVRSAGKDAVKQGVGKTLEVKFSDWADKAWSLFTRKGKKDASDPLADVFPKAADKIDSASDKMADAASEFKAAVEYMGRKGSTPSLPSGDQVWKSTTPVPSASSAGGSKTAQAISADAQVASDAASLSGAKQSANSVTSALAETSKAVGVVGDIAKASHVASLSSAIGSVMPWIGAAVGIASLFGIGDSQKPDFTTKEGKLGYAALAGRDYTGVVDSGYSDVAGMRQLLAARAAESTVLHSFNIQKIEINEAKDSKATADAVMEALQKKSRANNKSLGES